MSDVTHTPATPATTAVPWRGGTRAMLVAGGLGLAGSALTLVGGLGDASAALHAWLFAFMLWLGLAVGSLGWLMSFHASRARWVVVTRRLLEHMTASLPIFALLIVPILVGMRVLYLWATPHPELLGHDVEKLLAHKRVYLNPTFFVVRAGLYFLLWNVLAALLRRWSLAQDAGGAPRLTIRQRMVGAGALPAHALAISFAAFDWLMSLHPLWQSTMFGLYVIAGNVVGACAVWILLTVLADRAGLLDGKLTSSHLHSQGKFLLAFTCFWAYIGFSQFMLIWIANLPDELPWYLARAHGGWRPVALFLLFGHFVVPFLILLSKDLKTKPLRLGAVAAWILLCHTVDVYWMVMPHRTPDRPAPHWTDLPALVGVGGIAIAFALWRARGTHMLPVGDPYLAESARYHR